MALAEAPGSDSPSNPRGVVAKRRERARDERMRAIMIATLSDRRVRIGDTFKVVAHVENSILRTTVAIMHAAGNPAESRIPLLSHKVGLGRRTGDRMVDLCLRALEAEDAVALRISWTAGQLGYAHAIIPEHSPDAIAARIESKGR